MRKPRPIGHLLMPNQVTDLVLPAHMAVSNLSLGCFSSAGWHDLAMFSDVVQILASEQGRRDVVATGITVSRTLIAIRDRRQRIGKWGASGDELTTLRAAINPMDAFMRRQATHKVRDALLRLDAALARAEAEGNDHTPLEIDPATLPRAAA